MKSNTSDYLKYWRVVRYFVAAKYKLSHAEIDTLLFLYSEKYFGRDKYDEYNSLLSWDRLRFEKLRQQGWIVKFRNRVGNRKALYQLSDKSINLIHLIYRKLNGEEIPESSKRNPMFKRNVSYSDKVYRNMIKEMNAFIRQQRHQTRELSSSDPLQ